MTDTARVPGAAGRRAIGQLRSERGDPLGTAFAVTSTEVLTAYHCIGDRERNIVAHRTTLVEMPGVTLTAEYVDGSGIDDIALLRTREAIPDALGPLSLGEGAEASDEFAAFGFPVAVQGTHGFAVSGTVTWPDAYLAGGANVLQLACREAAAELPMAGLSGAPVLVSDRVIGLIRWNEPRPERPQLALGATVFAAPATVILARWPQLSGTGATADNPPHWRDRITALGGRAKGLLAVDAPVSVEIFRTNAHEDDVNAVSLCHESHLASAGNDGTARVWDVDNGEEILRVQHPPTVNDVLLDCGRGQLVTAGKDGIARIWDLASGSLIDATDQMPWPLNALCMSPDLDYLVLCGKDAVIWDLGNGKPVRTISHHQRRNAFLSNAGPGVITGAAFNAGGTLLATSSQDRSVRLWRTTDWQLTMSCDHHGAGLPMYSAAGVLDVTFLGAKDWVATAAERSTQQIWSARTGRAIRGINQANVPMTRYATAVTATATGDLVCYGNTDGTAIAWNPATGSPAFVVTHQDSPSLADVSLASDGLQLATAGGRDMTARVWSPT